MQNVGFRRQNRRKERKVANKGRRCREKTAQKKSSFISDQFLFSFDRKVVFTRMNSSFCDAILLICDAISLICDAILLICDANLSFHSNPKKFSLESKHVFIRIQRSFHSDACKFSLGCVQVFTRMRISFHTNPKKFRFELSRFRKYRPLRTKTKRNNPIFGIFTPRLRHSEAEK